MRRFNAEALRCRRERRQKPLRYKERTAKKEVRAEDGPRTAPPALLRLDMGGPIDFR